MKQTANYQLNQWEQADRILMADFNADNLKVDGALAGLQTVLSAETAARKAADTAVQAQNCWEKLMEVTAETGSTQLDIDLSELDLSAYHKLILVPRLVNDDPYNNSAEWVQVNGVDSQVYEFRSSSQTVKYKYGASFTPGTGYVVEIEMMINAAGVYFLNRIMGVNASLITALGVLPIAQLTGGSVRTLRFLRGYANSGGHAAGSHVVVYGLKR